MPGIADWLEIDLAELSALVSHVRADDVERLGAAILAARRVYTTGQGRSGWIMRMAALRLMQVGLAVHVVGDATTPAIGPGDLLVVASGSGQTPSPIAQAQRAMGAGAQVALLTARPDSTLGRLANIVVHIPGETTKVQLAGSTRMPLAATLEQATLLVLDALVAWLAEQRGENQATLMARHANLE